MPAFSKQGFGGGSPDKDVSRLVQLEEQQVSLLQRLLEQAVGTVSRQASNVNGLFQSRASAAAGTLTRFGGNLAHGASLVAGHIQQGFSRMSLPDGPSSKQMVTAAREAMKKGGEALKLYGQLEATRSDPNMLATEKTAANIEATFSAMTLGVGNGFLQQAFNQSGFTDVRAVANKTYSEVMQAAEASFEMGAPLTQEEINQRASIRYQRNTIRKTDVRDRVLEAVDAVSRDDADRTLKSALYDEKNLGDFTNAVDKFGSFVDMLYEKGVEVPLKYWMGP